LARATFPNFLSARFFAVPDSLAKLGRWNARRRLFLRDFLIHNFWSAIGSNASFKFFWQWPVLSRQWTFPASVERVFVTPKPSLNKFAPHVDERIKAVVPHWRRDRTIFLSSISRRMNAKSELSVASVA
jgi:hypothetical protein